MASTSPQKMTTTLRRVSAWCSRLVARVTKHRHDGEKSVAVVSRSSETEHESWTHSSHLHSIDSNANSPGPSVTRRAFERATTARVPFSYRRTTPIRSTHCRLTTTYSNQDPPDRDNAGEEHDMESSLDDQLSLVASQRLRVAGLYTHAQSLKRRNRQQRTLESKTSGTLGYAGGSLENRSSGFVGILKAELAHDVRLRLESIGLDAEDSVPPWTQVSSDRWSCELAVGSHGPLEIREPVGGSLGPLEIHDLVSVRPSVGIGTNLM